MYCFVDRRLSFCPFFFWPLCFLSFFDLRSDFPFGIFLLFFQNPNGILFMFCGFHRYPVYVLWFSWISCLYPVVFMDILFIPCGFLDILCMPCGFHGYPVYVLLFSCPKRLLTYLVFKICLA